MPSLLSDLGSYEQTIAKTIPRIVLPVRGAWVSQGVREGHVAIDYAAPLGTPIVSTHRGVVTSIQDLTTGYGRHVRVRGSDNIERIYAHLSDVFVKLGQPLSAGSQIGAMGSTGFSTGSHLHYEVRQLAKNLTTGKMTFASHLDPWADLKGAYEPYVEGMRTAKQQLPRVKVGARSKRTPAPVIAADRRDAVPSVNFGQIESEVPIEPETTSVAKNLSTQIMSALASPFERAAIGAIGVILLVVGLFILSSGLRDATVKLSKAGIEAGKVAVGTAIAPGVGTVVGSAL